MISMLQQLYMIPSFRESILAVDDPKKEEVPKEDNLLFQLQCIFAFLNQSEQQYFNPQGFTNAFKDWDGNPTNVLIQMDVDEFFNMFMDKLEFAIKGSKQEKMIQDHFGGQYANELICKGCPHYSESKEPYLAVTLQVKNKKSIKDSLEALIEGEMLDGDNAYYCEKCDKKVSTLKRTCIKRLPKHLIMVLKRFEFDYNYMQKLKVNDYCEFPESINMEPYTQEGLKRREEQAKRDEKKEEDEEPPLEPKYPLELYDYKLSGVLVHSGVADGGHYYSFIKDRELTDEERWYEFNDELVKDFDKEDLESECFGGEEKWGDSNFSHFLSLKNTEKNRNAYVLFYERVSKEEIPYENEDEDEPAQPAENKEESDIVMNSEHHEEDIAEPVMVRNNTIKVPNEIGDMVEEDNRKYWQSRFMFSSQYSDFILELCSFWNTRNITLYNYDTKNRDYAQKGVNEADFKEEVRRISEVMKINHSENYSANKNIKLHSEKILLPSESIDIYQKYGGEKIDMIEFEIFKQVATFYLTVKQRAVPKELIPEILDLVKAYLNKSIKACRWLITQFSNKEVLYENMVTCPIPDMRKLTGGLIYCAMIHLFEEEKTCLQEYWEYKAGHREFYSNSHLLNFINLLISNIDEMKEHSENNSQFFCLLAKFAGLGPESRIYLLRAKILTRITNYYLQDVPIEDKEDDKSLIFEENETPEIGLPTSVENAYISIWEEMIMKKREAAIADGPQDYTYIWELFSLCFRSCQIGEASDLDSFLDHVRFKELEESDLRLFTLEEADYITLIKTCPTKIAIRFMGDILIHAMTSYPSLETKIKSLMVQEINDKQLDEIEVYFPLYKRYLMIQDDNTETRLADGIKSFLNIIENNVKFPTFIARFTAFLVKLCNRSRAVAEYLAATADDWEWIIEWMRKNPNTSKNGHNLKVYTRESANSQYKIKRLEDIKKGEITTYEHEYDSDDDLYDEKSYIGKKYDVNFLGQTWVSAEVHVALDEMVNLSYSHNNIQKSPWVSSELCEYAPHMAMQNRHDVVMIEEFKKIIREQYRSTIQQQEEASNQMQMSDSNGNFYDENNGYESVSDD